LSAIETGLAVAAIVADNLAFRNRRARQTQIAEMDDRRHATTDFGSGYRHRP
jgi:hypothetical protein